MNIFLDIETIPAQSPEEYDRIRSGLVSAAQTASPPKSYTKPETIDRWRQTHIESAEDDAQALWRKTALDGSYGEIAVIGYAFDDGAATHCSQTPGVGWDFDEKQVLGEFFGRVRHACAGQSPTYVGHNIPFDLTFLWRRAVILNVKPRLSLPYNAPPWRGMYIDTMYEWAGARGTIKLTELCRVLGISVDDDIDGSQVWDCWKAGQVDRIIRHCLADVERVREIHRRLSWR